MDQRKPTRSDQGVAVKPWWFHVEQRERRAGHVGLRPRVSLQAVFAKDGEYSENARAILGHLRPYL